MSQINDGGPAFSRPASVAQGDTVFGSDGMSFRAYAAVHIAAGLCVNGDYEPIGLARDAVHRADALIAELAKGGAA